VIVFVAPHTTWKQHEALFTPSARSFRFLSSPNLSKVVLSASQVGGLQALLLPVRYELHRQPTLDLCAAT
jgi:hypothetical protein